jgi:hypothetical protein
MAMMQNKKTISDKEIRDAFGPETQATYKGIKRSLDKLHRAGMIRSFGIGVWGRVD